MRYKAVVFDLDGTLLNTLYVIADSMNEVLKEEGFPIHEPDKYKFFIGNGAIDIVRRAVPSHIRDENIIKQYTDLFVKKHDKLITHRATLYPGISELLDSLTDKGIKMCILTNKPHHSAQHVVNELLSPWNFEILLGEKPNVPKKPDPVGAISITNFLGINGDNCLYVGDSGVDMETANNANMFAIGALWGFRPAQELLDCGAKALVSNPLEILDFL